MAFEQDLANVTWIKLAYIYFIYDVFVMISTAEANKLAMPCEV